MKTLAGKLVVALSSRAVFDFEEENLVFERGDDAAYMALQRERLGTCAPPGVAHALVRKLLRLDPPDCPEALRRVEVVVVSRNDPVSGLRVFRSAEHSGLRLERGVFTRGRAPWRYLTPLQANLFLSANGEDVAAALAAGIPAARVFPHSVHASESHPDEIRIAFDGDAVLFSDESERIFRENGLDAFHQHETERVACPLPPGPFKPLLEALHRLQHSGVAARGPAAAQREAAAGRLESGEGNEADDAGGSPVPPTPADVRARAPVQIRTALVTARSAPAHERAIRTLMDWGVEIDEAMFLGGLEKGPFLHAFEPDFFFDDQTGHCESAARFGPAGHVPSGIANAV